LNGITEPFTLERKPMKEEAPNVRNFRETEN